MQLSINFCVLQHIFNSHFDITMIHLLWKVCVTSLIEYFPYTGKYASHHFDPVFLTMSELWTLSCQLTRGNLYSEQWFNWNSPLFSSKVEPKYMNVYCLNYREDILSKNINIFVHFAFKWYQDFWLVWFLLVGGSFQDRNWQTYARKQWLEFWIRFPSSNQHPCVQAWGLVLK